MKLLNTIGNTPLIQLKNYPQIFAKLEYFNPGGSIKDRTALALINSAEKKGLIKPNYTTLVEASSGNFGIALSMIGSLKGYNVIVTIPEKMSKKKIEILKNFGSKVIVTENVPYDNPVSNIQLAKGIVKGMPNYYNLDQYSNLENPKIHYNTTGLEILYSMKNNIDAVVLTAGTGGTISGVSARIKQTVPNCKIYGVDPVGSILAKPNNINTNKGQKYKVEGIGYDFVPDVLDYTYIDEWIKVDDVESFKFQEILAKEEGLLCGGSSGSALAACQKIIETNPEFKRIVTIFPDSSKNY